MSLLSAISYKLQARQGAVLLSTILMIGAIVAMVGMAGLIVGVALNRSNASIRFSGLARAGAEAGVQDVMRRIILNTQWAPFSCFSLLAPTYSFTLAGGAVAVAAGVNRVGYEYRAYIPGRAGGYERRLSAVIALDPITNKVTLQSQHETGF